METKKQLKAQLRNKISKEYKDRLKQKDDKIGSICLELTNIGRKYRQEKLKREKLEEENEQLKDWIHRLQEFMDMDEDSRQQVIEKYKVEESLNKQMDVLMNSSLFNMFKMILY